MRYEELADELGKMLNVLDMNNSEMKLVVFLERISKEQLHECALRVASNHPTGPVPVYIIQNQQNIEIGKVFSYIRQAPRIRLNPDGTLITDKNGTIFELNYPVILIIEDFDILHPRDQRAFCHLAEGGGCGNIGGINGLPNGSLILCGITGNGRIEEGSLTRGITIELKQ